MPRQRRSAGRGARQRAGGVGDAARTDGCDDLGRAGLDRQRAVVRPARIVRRVAVDRNGCRGRGSSVVDSPVGRAGTVRGQSQETVLDLASDPRTAPTRGSLVGRATAGALRATSREFAQYDVLNAMSSTDRVRAKNVTSSASASCARSRPRIGNSEHDNDDGDLEARVKPPTISPGSRAARSPRGSRGTAASATVSSTSRNPPGCAMRPAPARSPGGAGRPRRHRVTGSSSRRAWG